eukprot:scaffold42957_cov105-Skeletonema_dohrnii-CCMP3373.AAC.2
MEEELARVLDCMANNTREEQPSNPQPKQAASQPAHPGGAIIVGIGRRKTLTEQHRLPHSAAVYPVICQNKYSAAPSSTATVTFSHYQQHHSH